MSDQGHGLFPRIFALSSADRALLGLELAVGLQREQDPGAGGKPWVEWVAEKITRVLPELAETPGMQHAMAVARAGVANTDRVSVSSPAESGTEELTDLIEEIARLPQVDRVIITIEAANNLEEVDQEAIDRAWAEEIARRVRSIEDGTAQCVPWEEAFERIRAGLAERRARRGESRP